MRRPYMLTIPRSRQQIRKDAYSIRKALGWEKQLYMDICYFVEYVIIKLFDPDFVLIVLEDQDLPGRLAEAVPDQHCIKVKQSVYDGAIEGHFWHRMTLAHEVGHYLYHSTGTVSFARLEPGMHVSRDYDPEAQADAFAAEFLMPVELIRNMDYSVISKKCGVSFKAASVHLREIERIKKNQSKKAYRHKKKPHPPKM